MTLVDSHLHFDDFVADGTVVDLIQGAREAGVMGLVAIGGSQDANQLAARVSREHPAMVRFSAGYDRGEVGSSVDWRDAEALLQSDDCVGVGETGLDYHYEPGTRLEQIALFEANLERAHRFGKPVIIHSREAVDDTLGCLRAYVNALPSDRTNPGILHCYTGDIPFARECLDLGLYISFSGIVTFRNADSLRDVARYVPLDRVLVETDAPYLAPVPHRGRRNEPAFVAEVAKCLADVREISLEDVARATTENARQCFRNLPEAATNT